MSTKRRPLGVIAVAAGGLASASALVLTLGDGSSASAAAEAEKATSNESIEAESRPPGGPRAESDAYAAEIRAPAAAKAGEEARLLVTLTPKGAFHVNTKYPARLRATEPAAAGLTFPRPMLGKEDARIEGGALSFELPFVAERPGPATVGGVLSFSVCSEARCLIEKVELTASVDVK